MLFCISEEHLGSEDVMHVAGSKFITFGCAVGGYLFMIAPAVMALAALLLRWSPIMLPYHVFGNKYELMQVEMEGSWAYWSLLGLDWVFFTAAALTMNTALAICFDGMLRITLVCKALR